MRNDCLHSFHQIVDLVELRLRLWHVFSRNRAPCQIGALPDRAQGLVQLMRQSSGHRAKSSHFACLHQLVLSAAQLTYCPVSRRYGVSERGDGFGKLGDFLSVSRHIWNLRLPPG